MPVLWWLIAMLATCTGIPVTWDKDNIESAMTAMELDSFEYQDKCNSLAEAEWAWLKAGAPASGPEQQRKMQAEMAMADQKRFASKYVHDVWDMDNNPPVELLDKMDLEGHPGDELLSDVHYQQKLNYTYRVASMYGSTRIPCFRNSTHCQMGLQDVRKVLARSGDTAELLHTWNQWHNAVKDGTDGYVQQLNLTWEAAVANEAENPTSYWLHQQELDSSFMVVTYEHAEELWQEIKPLYTKLHKYVARWLKHQLGDVATGPNIPAHLLGSLLGEDWSPLADLVSPPDDSTFKDIERGLSNQGLLGKRLFSEVANIMNDMGLQNLPDNFWKGVLFNGTCPTQAVRFCDDQGTLRISTCLEASWMRYLDAHEWMVKAMLSRISSENDVHIFRKSNRYNALWDAIPGMISLVAASPARLNQLNLLPKEKHDKDFDEYSDYDTRSDPPNPAVLLLVALRTLPRLPFYLAADQWRLSMLTNSSTNTSSWGTFRDRYQMVEAPGGSGSDISFLSDQHLISNRPYLTKFLATILQFQMWDYFTEDNRDNPVQAVKDKEELHVVMEDAESKKWPDVLADRLAINEISAYSLLQYFQPLEDLLEKDVGKNAPKVQRRVVDLNSPKPTSTANLTAPIWEEPLDQTTPKILAVSTTESSLPVTRVQEEDILDVSVNNETLANPHRNITEEKENEKNTSEARTAILAASLVVFALALTAGVIVAARRCYKRKYQRNRRPPTER